MGEKRQWLKKNSKICKGRTKRNKKWQTKTRKRARILLRKWQNEPFLLVVQYQWVYFLMKYSCIVQRESKERNVLNVSPNSEQHSLSQVQDVVVSSSSWERFVFAVSVLWTVLYYRTQTYTDDKHSPSLSTVITRQSINSLSLHWRKQTSIDWGRAVNDWNKGKWAITNPGVGEGNLGAEKKKSWGTMGN